jgi:hypothetical protein
MKTCGGSGGIAPHILNFDTEWRCEVSFTYRPLYPRGNSTRYPLDRGLIGPQSQSRSGGQEKRIPSLPSPWIEPGRPARNLVTDCNIIKNLYNITCAVAQSVWWLGYRLDDGVSIPDGGSVDRLWVPHSLLSGGYRLSFAGDLTTHLHLLQRSIMCGAIPSFHHAPSWCGA